MRKMKMRLVCKSVCLATLLSLLAVGAVHAQDSLAAPGTTSEIEGQSEGGIAGAATAVSAEPAAESQPAARPAFTSDYGWTFWAAYSFLDSNLSEGSENGTCTLCLGRDLISGWEFGGTRMFSENFGATIDYSGHNTHGCYPCQTEGRPDIDEDDQFFQGGITVAKPVSAHVKIFGEGFAGVMLAGARDLGPGRIPLPFKSIGHHLGPNVAVGGGADYMVSRRWGIRIIQIDYIWGDFNMTLTGLPQGQWGSVNDVRLSAGVIMHLGGSK